MPHQIDKFENDTSGLESMRFYRKITQPVADRALCQCLATDKDWQLKAFDTSILNLSSAQSK